MTAPPRVGLVAADELRIAGLTAILGTQFQLTLLKAPRATELAELSVVIIDATATAQLFPLVEAFQRMRPQVRLLVLGEGRDADYIASVIDAGVQGYLSHSSSEDEVHAALSAVAGGSMWAPRFILAKLLLEARRELRGMAPTPLAVSRRELEVLHLLLLGKSNQEIAESLKVKDGTVKSHLSRLMKKAGVTNRTELTMRILDEKAKFQNGTNSKAEGYF